ncbi:hypothetical protein D3C73_915750 [compost metagenome]
MLIQQSPVTFDQPFGFGPCRVLQQINLAARHPFAAISLQSLQESTGSLPAQGAQKDCITGILGAEKINHFQQLAGTYRRIEIGGQEPVVDLDHPVKPGSPQQKPHAPQKNRQSPLQQPVI